MDYTQKENPPALPNKALKQLSTLVQSLREADKEIEAMEKQLATKRIAADKLRCDVIPGTMENLGLAQIKLADGTTVSVKTDVRASIPTGARNTEDKREEAFKWLRDNGFGALIKVEVSATFGLGQEDKARKLLEQLTKKYDSVSLTEAVPAPTLRSFVTERLEEGKPIPECITVTSLPTTIIKEPK